MGAPDVISWTVETRSPEETIDWGRRLGRAAEAGDVVALVGELGSGKTHFAKGLAEGLDAAPAREVTSPTFVLCREYLGGRLPFYHFDAYRLRSAADFASIGATETLEGDGLSALEWADRVPGVLPEDRLEVWLDVTGEQARRVTFIPRAERSEALLAEVRSRSAGE